MHHCRKASSGSTSSGNLLGTLLMVIQQLLLHLLHRFRRKHVLLRILAPLPSPQRCFVLHLTNILFSSCGRVLVQTNADKLVTVDHPSVIASKKLSGKLAFDQLELATISGETRANCAQICGMHVVHMLSTRACLRC